MKSLHKWGFKGMPLLCQETDLADAVWRPCTSYRLGWASAPGSSLYILTSDIFLLPPVSTVIFPRHFIFLS